MYVLRYRSGGRFLDLQSISWWLVVLWYWKFYKVGAGFRSELSAPMEPGLFGLNHVGLNRLIFKNNNIALNQ
jgi:hypothetical protein